MRTSVHTVSQLRKRKGSQSSWRQIWGAIDSQLHSTLALLMCTPEKHRMCKNYGHIVGKETPSGVFCGDCNALITGSNQLRKASSDAHSQALSRKENGKRYR